jgi:hypothetical protein
MVATAPKNIPPQKRENILVYESTCLGTKLPPTHPICHFFLVIFGLIPTIMSSTSEHGRYIILFVVSACANADFHVQARYIQL